MLNNGEHLLEALVCHLCVLSGKYISRSPGHFLNLQISSPIHFVHDLLPFACAEAFWSDVIPLFTLALAAFACRSNPKTITKPNGKGGDCPCFL